MAIASYLPQIMMIKLKSDLNVLLNPDDPEKFETAEQIGVFFHEWIHYLHNTTTLLGLSSFNSSVALWHLFRNTYKDGVAGGSDYLPKEEQEYLTKILNVIEKIYFSNVHDERRLLNTISFESLEMIDVKPLEDPIIREMHTLQCKLKERGYDSEYVIFVNTHEIIENVAALLEHRLVTKLKGSPLPTPIVPYRIIELIAQPYNLNTEQLICCMLATLQTPSPPSVLLETFELANNAILSGQSPIEALKEFTLLQIKTNENFISDTRSFITESFPVDEFIGNGLKKVFNKIEQNITVHRRENPFFEISIIDQICVDVGNNFNDAIKKYDGCAVLIERSGKFDDVERDVMYEFINSDHSTDWHIFHAAYFFIGSHINKIKKSFVSHNEVKAHTCPFYTSCTLELRQTESSICKKTPWQSETWSGWQQPNKDTCWYGVAVRQTRLPEN
jgi:hypothetical protein